MIIKTGINVKCKKCNKIHEINPEDFDEAETNYDERNMGYEIQSIWEYEFNCDECGNELKILIEGYEYPAGVLNYQEFNVEGCIIVVEPTLEVNYNDEEDL
ncbi:hypothetical protein [Flavobacterium ginsengiterrae]|uniref:Uncharacterized protein n=1 Tax=Flavobacterium ginsengiterrae TaxID=871695 RepID=A0ABP7GQT8_9FLAO